jgi:hypothetical protein
MSSESEIRFSYSSLPIWPIVSGWKNSQIANMAKDLGYNGGVEFMPLRSVSKDILNTNYTSQELPDIKTGHVHFNPYGTSLNVLTRKTDPLRPNQKLAYYNLAMAEPETSVKVLNKLEKIHDNFPIVVYPYNPGGQHPYGTYQKQWLQTHPAVFNDSSKSEDLIKQLKNGRYDKIVWDIYHAMEATSSGYRPLSNWQIELKKLLDEGAIGEIHISPNRVFDHDKSINDDDWLKEMVCQTPNYDCFPGKIIKLVKEAKQNIPFVIEISPLSLYKAGIINPAGILINNKNFKIIHRKLIDYINKA